MKRPDIVDWTVWNWIGYVTLALGALAAFFIVLLRDWPSLASRLPDSFVANIGYFPLPLVLIASVSLIISYKVKTGRPIDSAVETGGADQYFQHLQAFEPPSEYKFLPIKYSVDMRVEIPNVECCFWVVNFYRSELVVSSF